jgi:cytochrome c oxidase subunit 1
MLFLNIPWSLGLIAGNDPQLARTLFWFTGHPLVYFWLLPVYVSWYGMLPKQAGGKLFSEPLARFAFWLFLVLSTPLGLHHQYVDPGIPAGWKALHAVLTYSVFFPSLLTLFNVIASLEIAGRAKGGKGWFGWIFKLPWGDPSFTAQALAGALFALGGISGLTNASYNLNLVTHNTAWIPGHLHLTVGTGVAFSFMGIAYWLVPKLAGKELWNKQVALWQAWTWLIGMSLMSNGLHILGLRYGVPRRSALGVAPYTSGEWTPFLIEAAIGGTILLISIVLLYVNLLGTVFASRPLKQPIEMPVAEPYDAHPAPAWLDQWRPWLVGSVALILVAYGPVMFTLLSRLALNAPGFRVW